MLINLERTIAYICPDCSDLITIKIDVFSISSKKELKLKCPEHSGQTVCASIRRSDKKYITNINCPICGDTHTFRTSDSSFWKRDLTSYQCPNTLVDIFYIGDSNSVNQAVAENEEMFEDGDFGDDFGFGDFNLSAVMMHAMVEYIRKLHENHELSCVCGNENMNVGCRADEILISCRRCGRSKLIAVNEENLNSLLSAETLIIE